MKTGKTLSKDEMKKVTGGKTLSICETGDWNVYEICYNCSIAYGIPAEQADRSCS